LRVLFPIVSRYCDKVRTSLNDALLLFKSNAAGATKRAAIEVLDAHGGYVDMYIILGKI